MKRLSLNKTLPFAVFFLFFYPLTAFPLNLGSPTKQIRATVEKVLSILRDASLKSDDRQRERRAKLWRAISPQFDSAEMAKLSLGVHWDRRTPTEQREFVKVFTDFLENSLAKKIESYFGEEFIYTHEFQNKNRAEVDTEIVQHDGYELSINYRLHLVNGNWKVYDIEIENISLVKNYRSQFNRIISKSSYEELIRRIRNGRK